MKRAFTLLELTLSCVIFAILLVLVSRVLKESYHLNTKALESHQMLLDLNSALLNVEKILSKCLKTRMSPNTLTCLLRDDENILGLDNDNNPYLINSTLVLDKNASFYSPKSQFLKVLQNRKDLFGDNEKILYVLVQDEVKNLEILDNQNLKADFVGVFLPLEAKLDLMLKDGKIIYELRPRFKDDLLKQSAIIAHDVSVFEFQEKAGDFVLEICMQKRDSAQCLRKRLYL